MKLRNNNGLKSILQEKSNIILDLVEKLQVDKNDSLKILLFGIDECQIFLDLVASGHNVTKVVYSQLESNKLKEKNQNIESIILESNLKNIESKVTEYNFHLVIMVNSWEEIIARTSSLTLMEILRVLVKNNLNIIWEYPRNIQNSYFQFFSFDDSANFLIQMNNFTIPLQNHLSFSLNFSSNKLVLINQKILENKLVFFNTNKDYNSLYRKKFKHQNNFYKIVINQDEYLNLNCMNTKRKALYVISNDKLIFRYRTRQNLVYNSKIVAMIEKRKFISGKSMLEVTDPENELCRKKLINLFLKQEKLIRIHGDLRPWNFIWNGKEIYLIDPSQLGDESGIPFWAQFFYMYALLKKNRIHMYEVADLSMILNSISEYHVLFAIRKDLNSMSLKNYLVNDDSFFEKNESDAKESITNFLKWSLVNGN
jgi:hypothetical protein